MTEAPRAARGQLDTAAQACVLATRRGAQALAHRDHAPVAVDEHDVDREPHPERVHRTAAAGISSPPFDAVEERQRPSILARRVLGDPDPHGSAGTDDSAVSEHEKRRTLVQAAAVADYAHETASHA